jgi:hypothetical protein
VLVILSILGGASQEECVKRDHPDYWYAIHTPRPIEKPKTGVKGNSEKGLRLNDMHFLPEAPVV